MNNDVNILHHLGIISRDMEAAVLRYERLGFMFTQLTMPRISLQAGVNPEPIGVGNRCAIFKNNYLEMLGVVDANRWASISREQRGPFDLDEPHQRYEGLHVQSRIIIVSPDHLQEILPEHTAPVIPLLAGFTVSSDLEKAKGALKERAIDFQMYGGRILVHAQDGYGAAVLFEHVNTNE